MDLRKTSLILAEAVDAWRVIPRLILIGYSWLVFQLYLWYKNIPTYVQERCDAAVLKIFLDSKMTLVEAQQLACTVVDVVGGPTAAQSAFVTTIIGLSTGIFGLYTATGRRWDGWFPEKSIVDNDMNGPKSPSTPPAPAPFPPQVSVDGIVVESKTDNGPVP